MKRSTANALANLLFRSTITKTSTNAPRMSSTSRMASSPPKTGERADPEARVLPDPEDEWRKERRIGGGAGEVPPPGKGSRLGPYHQGEEVEKEEEGGGEKKEEFRTPEKGEKQHQTTTATSTARQLLHRRIRSLSLSPGVAEEADESIAAPHGADASTLDDATDSAPGTPYGTRGHSDRADLDFLGPADREESQELFGAAEGARPSPPPRSPEDGQERPARAPAAPGRVADPRVFNQTLVAEETIWDRLRGPAASEANAASAEAAVEGRVGPHAREREVEEVAPRLGGGTGKAI